MKKSDDKKKQNSEIIETGQQDLEHPSGDNYVALVTQYTSRPDLFIEALENHDPGFIKRMIARVEEIDRAKDSRFWFGRFQSYITQAVSVVAALAILWTVYIVVQSGAGFLDIIALGIFYAITQGGVSGFHKIINKISGMGDRRKSDRD